MSFSYNKLWIILIEKGWRKEDLRKAIGASPTTIAAMGRGEGISPKVLERICEALHVQPGDIMEYIEPNHKSPINFDPNMNKPISPNTLTTNPCYEHEQLLSDYNIPFEYKRDLE